MYSKSSYKDTVRCTHLSEYLQTRATVRGEYHPGMVTCSIDGCTAPLEGRGWCRMHYLRWWRHGDPRPGQPRRGTDDVTRLMSHVRFDPSGCWIWTGSFRGKGYGQVRVRGLLMRAHRASYALLKGPLLEGLEIDHLCRVRSCVNPAHLEQVTHRVNVLRSYAARRDTP